jgi:hypothetical protein
MTQDAYAVFRPRRGRQFAWGFAGAQMLVFVVLAIVLPVTGFGGWGISDSVMLVILGLLVAWVLHRFAALRATPSSSALVVRNILVTTTVPWSDVVGVRFSGGDPWLYLDLTSGDDLAVMAIQKSDGPFARAEASRLAALVQAHGGRSPRPAAPPGRSAAGG